MPHLYKQERKWPTPVRGRLSRTQALLGKVILGVCVPVSGIKVQSPMGLSAHSAFHWWSGHCAAHMLWLSEKLTSCSAAGTNGCLDLRRRATALNGRVNAEWSSCPGSMARRARDSVAPLWRSSAGWMPVRIGRLSAGVGRRHPVTIHKASLIVGQWGGYEHCGTKQKRSTLQSNGPGLGWLFATLLLQCPNWSQQATSGVRRVMLASCKVTQGIGGTWAVCPTLLWGIWAWSRRAGFRCWSWLSAHA